MTRLEPAGFAPMPESALSHALEEVRDALRPEVALDRLRRYYDPAGQFAGATFVYLPPVTAHDFTAADLFAVTLLSVDPPSPLRTRSILEPNAIRAELLELLGTDELGLGTELADADDTTMRAMSRLYSGVKAALGVNPWVTASKLCARKRPSLFPVRDDLVCGPHGLDLAKYRNFEVDWQVFRAIMRDDGVRSGLQLLANRSAEAGVQLDLFPLRWLDVVLWMRAREGRQSGP